MSLLTAQVLDGRNRILYSANSKIGDKYANDTSLFKELRETILRIPDKSTEKFYDYLTSNKAMHFRIKISPNIIFVVVSDSLTSLMVCEDFLLRVESEFKTHETDFDILLASVLNHYNENSSKYETNAELKKAKDICCETITSIVSRGGTIVEMSNIVERLKAFSKQYNSDSNWQYYIYILKSNVPYVIIGLMILLFLAFYFFR